MATQRSERVPTAMRPTYEAIVALTDAFCQERLNEECAVLCRRLAAALARKRPSPLARGAHEIWACGIVYALGSVNFLFDQSQTPHIRIGALCEAFGVKQRTGADKARLIREMFGMHPFDPDWCLPTKMDDNPLRWILQVDGLYVDVRRMPRQIQEIAYRNGLIPYIPADRQEEQRNDDLVGG